MTPFALARTLLLAAPVDVSTQTTTGTSGASTGVAAVPSVIAALSPPPQASLAGSTIGFGWIGGLLIIAALGALALLLRQRQRAQPRHIRILETASLGPKRGLALVVVNRQSLLLSCCDAGITLLTAQEASPELLQAADRSSAKLPATNPPSGVPTTFDSQLIEAEDLQQLRRRFSQADLAS